MRLKGGDGNGIKKEDEMRREKRVVNEINETELRQRPFSPSDKCESAKDRMLRGRRV